MTPARSAVVLQAGMTHREAREAVAAVWPSVVLRLYYGTTAFYKEGVPYAEDALADDEDVLRSPGYGYRTYPTTGPVVLTGTDTPDERRGRIYAAFGLEAEFECCSPHLNASGERNLWSATLDQIQTAAEQMRVAFEGKLAVLPKFRPNKGNTVCASPGDGKKAYL